MQTERQDFFQTFNEAFVKGDVDKILASVTDDITWRMVGNDTIKGIDNLKQALQGMDNSHPFEQDVETLITQEKEAVVNGTIHSNDTNGEQHHYGFCDIYKLDKVKDGKIEEIISYVVEL